MAGGFSIYIFNFYLVTYNWLQKDGKNLPAWLTLHKYYEYILGYQLLEEKNLKNIT